MYILAKRLGFWNVSLISTKQLMFKSLSRKTASDWRNANMPAIPKFSISAMNAQCGATVWSAR